jgi:hypothetical protein
MKSKIILGLAAIAALALPAAAQEGYCYLDRDGDSQICVAPTYNYYGYYGYQSYPQYNRDGYYRRYDGNSYYYGGRDRDYWRHEAHEEHERRERIEHERHEWREHHRDYDDR